MTFEPVLMRVSPSPQELFDRLTDEEKIAIDLIQQQGTDEGRDAQLRALVPAEGRRGYLRTLAMQLPTCVGSATMDAEAATWAAAREREAARLSAVTRDRAAISARDLAWLEALAPEARRAVARQRRRRARRHRR